MPLSPQLRAAYEAARYAVLTDPMFVFRIGEHSAEIDAFLEEARTATAAAALWPSARCAGMRWSACNPTVGDPP